MKSGKKSKNQARQRRHGRVRAKVFGTAQRPRLSVFRSLKYIFLQLIDDEKGKTILGFSSRGLKPSKENPYQGKKALAFEAGRQLAKEALAKGVKEVCFDRGGYLYHGRVAAAAEGARNGGLKF